MASCPICNGRVDPPRSSVDSTEFVCSNCGHFLVSGSAGAVLDKGGFSPNERARLAFALKRRGGGTLLTSGLLESLIATTSLPDAASLQDNLLLHLAYELDAPGEKIDLAATDLRASIGALTASGVQWVIQEALNLRLIVGLEHSDVSGAKGFRLRGATLSAAGWERVRELTREGVGSRKAFMAMKFGDAELDTVFASHFRPAVAKAGFNLVRLDDTPRAGLIDDRLRLEIRTCRLLIADLSHANNGAYWEAGFAEGLGRPVIYTCRKDVFNDASRKPHFDTNHHLTVVWDPGDLAAACELLKTTIRVTLPAEATLAD
jgi:hypothetical protein